MSEVSPEALTIQQEDPEVSCDYTDKSFCQKKAVKCVRFTCGCINLICDVCLMHFMEYMVSKLPARSFCYECGEGGKRVVHISDLIESITPL